MSTGNNAGNTGGGTPPPPPVNQQTSANDNLITWGIRGVMLFFLLFLLFRTGCNKSEEESPQDAEENYELKEVLEPMGEYNCYPGQELSLPPVKFTTGGLKIRVNGHSHYLYYPSIKDWVYRDKKIDQYASPEVHYEDVIRVKADTSEKELFVVYVYHITEMKVPKK